MDFLIPENFAVNSDIVEICVDKDVCDIGGDFFIGNTGDVFRRNSENDGDVSVFVFKRNKGSHKALSAVFCIGKTVVGDSLIEFIYEIDNTVSVEVDIFACYRESASDFFEESVKSGDVGDNIGGRSYTFASYYIYVFVIWSLAERKIYLHLASVGIDILVCLAVDFNGIADRCPCINDRHIFGNRVVCSGESSFNGKRVMRFIYGVAGFKRSDKRFEFRNSVFAYCSVGCKAAAAFCGINFIAVFIDDVYRNGDRRSIGSRRGNGSKEFNVSRNCVSGGLSRRGVNCRNEICKIFGRTVNVFVYADKFNVLKVVFYDFKSSPVLAYIGIFKVFLKLGILPKNIETVSESLYLICHLCGVAVGIVEGKSLSLIIKDIFVKIKRFVRGGSVNALIYQLFDCGARFCGIVFRKSLDHIETASVDFRQSLDKVVGHHVGKRLSLRRGFRNERIRKIYVFCDIGGTDLGNGERIFNSYMVEITVIIKLRASVCYIKGSNFFSVTVNDIAFYGFPRGPGKKSGEAVGGGDVIFIFARGRNNNEVRVLIGKSVPDGRIGKASRSDDRFFLCGEKRTGIVAARDDRGNVIFGNGFPFFSRKNGISRYLINGTFAAERAVHGVVVRLRAVGMFCKGYAISVRNGIGRSCFVVICNAVSFRNVSDCNGNIFGKSRRNALDDDVVICFVNTVFAVPCGFGVGFDSGIFYCFKYLRFGRAG